MPSRQEEPEVNRIPIIIYGTNVANLLDKVFIGFFKVTGFVRVKAGGC